MFIYFGLLAACHLERTRPSSAEEVENAVCDSSEGYYVLGRAEAIVLVQDSTDDWSESLTNAERGIEKSAGKSVHALLLTTFEPLVRCCDHLWKDRDDEERDEDARESLATDDPFQLVRHP